MASLTTFAENKILDHLNRGDALGLAADWHYALLTAAADPEAGAVTEVNPAVWTNYARSAHTRSPANYTAAANGAAENATVIDFGVATIVGAAPVVTHLARYDAAAAGNAWQVVALATPKTINNGDPVSIPIGDLDTSAD